MKELELTKGKVALVDDDFYWLSQWNWFATNIKNNWYAVRSKKKGKLRNGDITKFQIFLHRVVMRVNDSKIFVDHIDGNGLNNQKNNLRFATHLENCWNRVNLKISSSGYKGVSWNKERSKWVASICTNRKKIHLGYFDTKEFAALAYDEASKKHHKKFSSANYTYNITT